MTSPLETTLASVAAALDRHRIPYMLIGGYAVGIHGSPRFTQDIDITLGVDTDAYAPVLSALVDRFIPLPDAPRDFTLKTNVLPLKDKATGIRVDLIFSFLEFEKAAIESAESIDLDGQPVKIISPTHLIIYKLLAGRPRDVEDAQNVFLCNRDTIDTSFIQQSLDELAPLANPEAIRQWQEIIHPAP
jgi:hypothetical protein